MATVQLQALSCQPTMMKLSELSNYHYLMITGIFNEMSPFYMQAYKDYLVEHGVPSKNIFNHDTRSYVMPSKAVGGIEKKVKEIGTTKKLIIFAHSKGALETLYYLHLKGHDVLQRAFLIHGAVDGASLYQIAHMKGELSYSYALLKKLTTFTFSHDFSREAVRRQLQGLEQKKELIRKLHFVATKTTYDHLPLKYKITGMINERLLGSVGDGLLHTQDHIPYALRNSPDLCYTTEQVHHDELVKVYPWEDDKRKRVYKFIESLLRLPSKS